MYDCPGCGGNLKFDIPTQRLLCSYCNNDYDPYQITKDKDGEEQKDFEATIFTCPQCGGEIMSTDTTAAGFCSFCGASTILTSRVSREKKPNFIIPFQKTKDDCKREYQKLMRRFIYAPNAIKDPDRINGFRGIYMPYWVYYFSQRTNLKLKGSTSTRKGDYVYTKHYNLNGELNAYYKGINFDGSSSFSDAISESIAPYDVKHMKEFTPSILSGFYADTNDLGKDLYSYDAKKLANDETWKLVKSEKEFSKHGVSQPKDLSGAFNTKEESADLAMFPVWFMSYKNGDRVAYATINGQTGKIFADLPVSISKYLLGALIMSVPIFFLLNAFLTIIPTSLVVLVAFIAAVVGIVYACELSKIASRELDEDDKGKQEAKRLAEKRKEEKEREAARAAGIEEPAQKKKKSKMPNNVEAKTGKSFKMPAFLMFIIILCLSVPVLGAVYISALAFGNAAVCGVSLIVVVIAHFVGASAFKKIDAKKGLPTTLWVIIAEIIACFVSLFDLVKDVYYYGVAILMLVTIGVVLIDIISSYNLLATRKIPQFDYQGGDDNA
ncbi:MAG: hypothetical protein K6G76_00630 [Lachnospiraceae bacterium]|nr:hypothetical protein [Lachnospiraceae bacterium]